MDARREDAVHDSEGSRDRNEARARHIETRREGRNIINCFVVARVSHLVSVCHDDMV